MKLLTVKETAELLRVTPHSVCRMARNGAIPSLRVGHQVRIDEAALEAWLCNQASAPAEGDEKGRLPR